MHKLRYSLAVLAACALAVFVSSSRAFANEDANPFHPRLPAQPPYRPNQRIIISDPDSGSVLTHSPDRITVNFRRFDFDLRPSSLQLWLDGVEYTESLKFWTDVAWLDLPAGLTLREGEHLIEAHILDAQGIDNAAIAQVSIFFGPCGGGCPWPFAPTDQPSVVSNLMEDWQDFGSTPYFHSGIDILAPAGTPVHSCTSGTVVKKDNYRSGDPTYWEVAVQDSKGYIWQYHHLNGSSITVNQGDAVSQGQVLGNVVSFPESMNGYQYNHCHLNVVRWMGGGAIPGPYVDGWRYYNPLNFLAFGSYTDTVFPHEFDLWFTQNESNTPFAADSDPGDPVLTGKVDIIAQLRDQMTEIPPTNGQPYELGIYDLSWSAAPINTPCGMGVVPRTRLARFDQVPGGTTVNGNAAALNEIYKPVLLHDGGYTGAKFDYYTQQFFYVLTNTKNGYLDDVNGYWDTAAGGSLGALYPDGQYVVKVFAKDIFGNETVTPVTVTLQNGITYSGICPPYILDLRYLESLHLYSASGASYSALPPPLPVSLGPVSDGRAHAMIGGAGWPAWYFDLPERGERVAIGLLNGYAADVEYIPLLGDVILTADAEVQVLPIGGTFDPNLPSLNPMSLRLSTRLARDPSSGAALIGTPAPRGQTAFDLVMARPIVVNGEPMVLSAGGSGAPDAQWDLNPVSVEPAPLAAKRATVTLDASPNPFAAGGTFKLTIDRDENIVVDVLDAGGRRVRQIFHGDVPRGEHEIRWDARDALGSQLPMGVYFVRAWGSGVEARRKIVMLR